MKQSQIILLSVFLLITGGIYFSLRSNHKEFDKEVKKEQKTVYVPIKKVHNAIRSVSMTSYGQVTPYAQIMVAFEVQGKLLKGNITMKPGTNFSKGQILYRVDNQEAFFTLSARKSALSTMVLNALPDIELDFPTEKNKWIKFLNALDPSKQLPELPSMSSSKEASFAMSRNIFSEYYNLKSQEVRLEKYFYVAPFSGTVISTFAEPGSITNPGAQVAQIAKTGNFEVKVPISMEDLQLYKDKSTATFEDASGHEVATGKIARVSNVINQQTQSADVYYSIKALPGETVYNGMHLNVSIERKAMKSTVTIPRTAVKEGIVSLLEGNKIAKKEVMMVGSKPDSVFVSGLTDGSRVILEQVDQGDEKTVFKGIER